MTIKVISDVFFNICNLFNFYRWYIHGETQPKVLNVLRTNHHIKSFRTTVSILAKRLGIPQIVLTL